MPTRSKNILKSNTLCKHSKIRRCTSWCSFTSVAIAALTRFRSSSLLLYVNWDTERQRTPALVLPLIIRAQLMTIPPYVCACAATIGSSYFSDRLKQRGLQVPQLATLIVG